MSALQFTYAIVYVDDVRASLAFYEQAFGFKTHFLHESGDWGELDTGATRLCFSSRKLMASMGKPTSRANPKQPSFELAFTTNDLTTALQKALAAGATLISDIEHTSWGQTLAYVADKDNILIEICTPT